MYKHGEVILRQKNLNDIWNNQILKIKNNLLELEQYFTELRDRELKETEVKIKGEIEEWIVKLISLSVDVIENF